MVHEDTGRPTIENATITYERLRLIEQPDADQLRANFRGTSTYVKMREAAIMRLTQDSVGGLSSDQLDAFEQAIITLLVDDER